MESIVRTARRGAVLEVTLDRPPVNAISLAVSHALHAAFETLRDDPDLRVGILTGAGERVFSAGWDMKEVAAAESGAEVNDAAVGAPGGVRGAHRVLGPPQARDRGGQRRRRGRRVRAGAGL